MKAGFLTVGLYIAYLAVSAIPLVMAGCAISRYKIDGTIFRGYRYGKAEMKELVDDRINRFSQIYCVISRQIAECRRCIYSLFEMAYPEKI
ncbi:unnamed protein product [Onchocerca flexuosa]|uniref:ABC transmembrane type-1 domain-containing protein n=1 Tax=Onchocerca flexuosa TaxID=387005 RepID=A0A183GYQ1_9BILA|nr:unnamed protein product [Onchocerca flexuosa]